MGKDTIETILTGLAYYKKYRVRVAAYNDKGPGVLSPEFYVTTLQGVPSQPPSSLELIATNSTSINAQWLPPPYRELNGVNMGYDIEIWIKNELKRLDIMRFDEKNPTGTQVRFFLKMLFIFIGLIGYTDLVHFYYFYDVRTSQTALVTVIVSVTYAKLVPIELCVVVFFLASKYNYLLMLN